MVQNFFTDGLVLTNDYKKKVTVMTIKNVDVKITDVYRINDWIFSLLIAVVKNVIISKEIGRV